MKNPAIISISIKFGYFVFSFLDAILQRLIKVDGGRLCYVSGPDYSDNAYYVYKHVLTTRQNLKHIWLLNDIRWRDAILEDFAEINGKHGGHAHNLNVYKKRSLKGYFAYLRSKYTFHTHGAYTFSKYTSSREVVSLWHGMPIKCIGELDRSAPHTKPEYGTLHIATSSFFRYVVAQAFSVPVERVLLCGMPRCKPLLVNGLSSQRKSEILAQLGLDGARLVLWMPTFRLLARKNDRVSGGYSFINDLPDGLMSDLAVLAKHNGCKVIVKLHPYDALNYKELPYISDSILLLRACEWAETGIQLYDLVACADALISDVSSILIDYLVTGKPMALAGFEQSSYNRKLTFNYDLLRLSGRYEELKSNSDIQRFFDKLDQVNDNQNGKVDLSRMFYEHPQDDGCDAILSHLGL